MINKIAAQAGAVAPMLSPASVSDFGMELEPRVAE